MNYVFLITACILPAVVSAILKSAPVSARLERMTNAKRHFTIGAIFGIVAIIATETGSNVGGAILNVRDAAPLCAGLLFSAPAGIIAGLIGGIERYMAPLWGGGVYTRLACTLGTIFAGLIGAALRKTMFTEREPKWMYGEEFAPETADNETMSGCLMSMKGERHFVSYLAEDAGHFVPFTAPDWALKLPAGDSLHRFPGNLTSGEWWIENPTDLDDLWEQEEIRDELIRLSLGYFHWLKNSYARRDLAAHLRLVSFPRYNAKRETRRLIGDYVLTQNDVTKVTVFDDAISYCGWTLDVHHPRGLFSGKEGPYFSDSYVPITSIPYRCIYSKNVSNLFMAGRCASVSHLALGTVRVESTLATLGQAAGTAAALCLEKGVMPRELGQEYIDLLQQTLLRDDQSIPWLRNHDSADLARSAHISADSFSRVEPFNTEIGVETGWDELDTPRATTVLRFGKELGTDENPDFFSVQLKNETDHPIDVPCQYIARSIVHPDVLESASITVPARFSGWIELPFTPQRDIFPWGVYLGAAPGVFWRQFDYTTLSRNRAFLQDRYTWKTNGNNAYCLKYSKRPLPLANCAPDNVINGLNRALSAQDYAWVSDPEMPLPQFEPDCQGKERC